MIFWAIIITTSMLFVPFSQQILNSVFRIYDFTAAKVHTINNYYRIFELAAPRKALLPDAPSDTEKWLYSDRRLKTIIIFSLISFSFVTFSMTRFLAHNSALWTLFAFLALTVLYYIISLFVNIGTKDFDMAKHKKLISKWRPKTYPTVDIFLPTAGEETRVLANTWDGVKAVIDYYKGKIIVSVLDDSARKEVKRLAKSYGFNYEVRANRGQYKKAGNLRHGFNVTNEEFIVIFDADFKPRFDFLNELLPYMSADPKLGIVQSPQYFDVNNRQNWLEF
jgi:cellulose synthase (UDP-forming)